MHKHAKRNVIIDFNAFPSDLPKQFIYLLSKADLYLRIGPECYRNGDALGMPDEECSPEELAAIQLGMEQICQLRGYTPENPFRDLDIDGFYPLMRTLHFNLEKQVLAEFREEAGEILDEMHMVHAMTKESIVLYNLVPTPAARQTTTGPHTKKGKKTS